MLFFRECLGQAGEDLEMLFCGIGRNDQADHQCDGLVVNRVKIQTLTQAQYRSLRFTDAIEPAVG